MKTKLLLVALLFIAASSCKKGSDDEPDNTINPWDGRYRFEGTMTDHVDPAFVWPGNTYEYQLEATNSMQVIVGQSRLGIPGHIIKNGINESYYSEFGLVVTFDPVTNKITNLTNYYGQPSPRGRLAVLDPSGENKWDPVTKNIKIKYWMDDAGTIGHHASFDETWVYIGAR